MPSSSYTYMVPAVRLELTTPAYETGDYPLRLRWRILAGAARFELASPGLESGSLAVSLRPCKSQFTCQRPKQKPQPKPGSDGAKIHTDP